MKIYCEMVCAMCVRWAYQCARTIATVAENFPGFEKRVKRTNETLNIINVSRKIMMVTERKTEMHMPWTERFNILIIWNYCRTSTMVGIESMLAAHIMCSLFFFTLRSIIMNYAVWQRVKSLAIIFRIHSAIFFIRFSIWLCVYFSLA